YPVIKCFGNFEHYITQESVYGSTETKIEEVILRRLNGVSFRGLVKKNIPDKFLYLCEDQYKNIMADTIWILQHAIAGDMYSIDVVYLKRYHDNNEHTKWGSLPVIDKLQFLSIHSATIFDI